MNKLFSTRNNKRILVGVTGGIAAYKSPDLVRRLKERGADVRVVMTAGAKEFITPLTLQAVSGYAVYEHLLDTDAESGMGHIELARWAEMILVAPATANFISKCAHGQADDLLSTLVVATTAELVVAPAMNQQMWQHPTTQENLRILQQRGIRIIGPGSGDQACGEVGPGRMTEPEEIAQLVLGDGIPQLFVGKTVLITAGPTWEAIDPVRGITNHSSGKMGFSMAQAALDYGAKVILISGPVHLDTPAGVHRIDIESAQQMYDRVFEHLDCADVFISVAAVADYRPENPVSEKIKKSDDKMTIHLVKNPDILAAVGKLENKPVSVGFAAETQHLMENAAKKLKSKNVDMIIANNVAGEEGAFGNDSNAVTLLLKNDTVTLKRMDKYGLAVQILQHVYKLTSSS